MIFSPTLFIIEPYKCSNNTIIRKLREYCEENNLDLTDAFELVGFTKGGMIRKTKAKFKDPVTGKLWAGRGKTPKWYLERITQGFTEQDLLA